MRIKTGLNEAIAMKPTCIDCYTIGDLWFCRNENKNSDECYGYVDKNCPFYEKYMEMHQVKLDGRIEDKN